MSIKHYFHPPAIAAGFASVLIGYSSSAVIVFQAAWAAGATPEQIGSWMIALGIGMGLTTLGLSWHYKIPIITAWSTPGAPCWRHRCRELACPRPSALLSFPQY